MTTPGATTATHAELRRVGRFSILRELGRGSAGCVYLAHDPVIGRELAIKIANPRLGAVEKSRCEQQFINEARAAGRLSHQNIVAIYDAGGDSGTTYIAMEYLHGRELSRLLDGGHRYAPQEVASIAWRVADALDHAHRRGVIHRDIKPANIFMVGDLQPKLIDFGIARSPERLAPDRDIDESYTIMAADALLGTPYYMSPEQAQAQAVDARTDIYSLGAVMYEMLTGRKPFDAESAEKLLAQAARKPPPAPHQIAPEVPAGLSRIVMRAMSRQPEQRFQDAHSMALAIRRYLLKERRARRRQQAAPGADAAVPVRGASRIGAALLALMLTLLCAALLLA